MWRNPLKPLGSPLVRFRGFERPDPTGTYARATPAASREARFRPKRGSPPVKHVRHNRRRQIVG